MERINSSDNPIAEYAREQGIQATELAKRLGVSKGTASELINGRRGCGPKTARRMEQLTGRNWREYIYERHAKAEPAGDGATA